MKYTYTNEKLNEVIRDRIPKGVKTIPYLMDLLNLSKESAYRRLRNEIAYTMQEAAILASELNISFDEIFGYNSSNEKIYSSLTPTKTTLPIDHYVEVMKSTVKSLKNVSDNKYTKAFYVGNRVPNGFLLNYSMLSKLLYIKWIHQTHNLPIYSKFSEIALPSQVNDVHREYLEASKKIDHFTAVLDENIIQSIINTITFYYRRNLISDDEILELKYELLTMVAKIEDISRTGKSKDGQDNLIYLSDLHIESNIIPFEFQEGMSVHLMSSGRAPIVTNNIRVCEDQKQWIDSLFKFSVLITRSNEILQAEFFTKQRALIEAQLDQLIGDKIDNKDLLHLIDS